MFSILSIIPLRFQFTGHLKVIQCDLKLRVAIFRYKDETTLLTTPENLVLFGECPIEVEPKGDITPFVDSVVDSSRYFVVRLAAYLHSLHVIINTGCNCPPLLILCVMGVPVELKIQIQSEVFLLASDFARGRLHLTSSQRWTSMCAMWTACPVQTRCPKSRPTWWAMKIRWSHRHWQANNDILIVWHKNRHRDRREGNNVIGHVMGVHG